MNGSTGAEKQLGQGTSSEDSAPEDAASVKQPETEPAQTGEPTAPAPPPEVKISQSVVHENVERLKKEQATLRAARKRISAELRNATKTKTRLKKRARLLSNTDLMEVIQLRRIDKDARAVPDAADAHPATAGAANNAKSTALSSKDRASQLAPRSV